MTAPTLYYSAILFGICSVIAIVLASLVILMRRSELIGLGDGNNKKMRQRIRAHANFLEYLLPFSLLYLVYEINGGSEMVLIGTGVAFVIARILHPLGILKSVGTSFGRFVGTTITWFAILILAIANIILVLN